MTIFSSVSRFRFATAATLAIISLVSTPALASSCSEMEQGYRDARAAENRVIRDYPGSTLVFAGCSAAAIDQYNRTGNVGDARATLTGCAMIGCALTGDWKGCMGANVSLLLVALYKQDLTERYRRICY